MLKSFTRFALFASLSVYSVPGTKSQTNCPDANQTKARADQCEHQLRDWANIGYFKKQNSELATPGPNEERVVFMGDSILGIWYLPQDFPGQPFVNRAIGGQTSAQMLVRFRADVIALKPRVVIILGGINDLRFSPSAEVIQNVKDNLMSMAEIARANHVRVIFGSLTPVANIPDAAGRPNAQFRTLSASILEVNAWLKHHSSQAGDVYVDFYSVMVDQSSGLRADLTDDGIHPNRQGFKVMAPLVLRAVLTAEAAN